MSGDLLTLRLMVVSADEAEREPWGKAAALAPVPIEFRAIDPAAALPRLKREGVDILVVDADVANCDALMDAARALKPVPLIAVVVSDTSTGVAGADSVFLKPAGADQARSHVERLVRLRLPKRILIVDDSRTMRSIVRKIVSASRFQLEISEAEGGAAALKEIANGYDIVLLDYNMPGFNGIETLTEIKRISPDVAVVIMTATDHVVAGHAQASGATAFLKKPFYPGDIDAIVARLYDAGGPA